MALTNEDLQALSTMMEQKLQPINNRLDKIENCLGNVENRLDKVENRLSVSELKQKTMADKLDDLQLDIKIAERNIKRAIHNLNDEMETVIEILKLNDLLPR